MRPTTCHIRSGERQLTLEIGYDRFRTLRIAVRPEGTVRVRAPRGADPAWVRARLEDRAEWIFRCLERFEDRRPAASPRYESGEEHRYLGRGYALAVLPGSTRGRAAKVLLAGDALEVRTAAEPTPERVRALLDGWYAEQAREVFTRVLRELMPRLSAHGVRPPTRLRVRTMRSRWGSCARSGSITLNTKLVLAPLECVEFVAAHELCHLRHHGHDRRFYALLSAVMPDWRERKAALARAAIPLR